MEGARGGEAALARTGVQARCVTSPTHHLFARAGRARVPKVLLDAALPHLSLSGLRRREPWPLPRQRLYNTRPRALPRCLPPCPDQHCPGPPLPALVSSPLCHPQPILCIPSACKAHSSIAQRGCGAVHRREGVQCGREGALGGGAVRGAARERGSGQQGERMRGAAPLWSGAVQRRRPPPLVAPRLTPRPSLPRRWPRRRPRPPR